MSLTESKSKTEKQPPLNDDEVKAAQSLISMNHLDLTHDFLAGYPWLRKFKCGRKMAKEVEQEEDWADNLDHLKDHTKESQLKGALLKKLGNENSELKKETKKLRGHSKKKQHNNLDAAKKQDDPLLDYGFGINAYRFTLLSLSILFFIISLFAGFMMYVYD